MSVYDKLVEEKDFFKIADLGANSGRKMLPMTPWVLIQFRAAIADTEEQFNNFINGSLEFDIENNTRWETVSFRKASASYNPTNNVLDQIDKKGSLEFDNFFDGISLEDNGGVLKCDLNLYDPYFGRLEDIITRSIVAMKLGNAFFEQSTFGRLQQADVNTIQFNLGKPQNINFRLRFGYADPSLEQDEIIDGLNEDDFKERTQDINKNKMVVKTPWKYFQMMGCKFAVTDSGLNAQVNGVSIGKSILDRLKIVRRFAIIRGTPANIIQDLGREVFTASQGMVQIVDQYGNVIIPDDINPNLSSLTEQTTQSFRSEYGPTWEVMTQEEYEEEYDTDEKRRLAGGEDARLYRVEVPLGSEPRYRPNPDGTASTDPDRIIREYMSVKRLFSEICSQVPPIYKRTYNVGEDERIVYFKTSEQVKQIFTTNGETVEINGEEYPREQFTPIRYVFSIKEVEFGNQRVTRIRFHYKKPSIRNQDFIRSYTWKNWQNSLITSFGIDSKFDFAQINSPIALIETDSIITASEGISRALDNNEGSAFRAYEDILSEENPMMFTRSVVENSNNDGSAEGRVRSRTVVQEVISNLNRQVFSGVIEIPGDPFFLFDETLEPYSYFIYLRVLRDWNPYIDEIEENLNSSYFTGFYVIQKIDHEINSGGFITKLTVSKWPGTIPES
ncbi:MAG: hypothetical protein ACOC1O_00910 [bacterium]